MNAKVAAFSFLGMVLWTYKWYRPDGGSLSPQDLAREMQEMFFGGLEPRREPPPPARSPAPRRPRRTR